MTETDLDAFLAEHVLGLKRVTKLKDYKRRCFITNGAGDVLIFGREPYSCFKPRTDPAAAMEVLEKIVEKLGTMPPIGTAGRKFVWANPKKHEPIHDADTLLLAICKFAEQCF